MKKSNNQSDNTKNGRYNNRSNEKNEGNDKKDDKLKIETIYKKKTLHEHILSLPDTYIGTTKVDEVSMFIYNDESNMISEELISYVAGLFKIFDEILVNARDRTVVDPTCNHIKINIDKQSGIISVWNNGIGIPIVIHKEENVYLPEFLFGNLLSSSHFDKKGKTVGGKNGYGAKLANIYSRLLKIRAVGYDRLNDIKNAKKKAYEQIFRQNMYLIEPPIINDVIDDNIEPFTEISFLPDYARFGMMGMTNDMYSLLVRRCYDLAACTQKNTTITINNEKIKCRDFKDYIKLYYPETNRNKTKIVHEKINSRWEIGIVYSSDFGDRYISFVNGISTFQGGKHVDHVVSNVITKVIQYIIKNQKNKDLKIQPTIVKQYLTFFINCIIEDPSFNSQTKEFMNSKMADWCTCGKNCADVKCNINDEFIEKLCDTGLMKEVIEISVFKEQRELVKTDGRKNSNLDIDKLIDAKNAATRNSHRAFLFLTEGDSAKSFAVAGFSIIGNVEYGVFPLRGKLLNVRCARPNQLLKNKEFYNLKQILGLKQNMKYKDVSKLRYGGIIILTDQDPDGSHIKGLIINMFEYFWPELLQIEGFIRAYNTPIVKVWKKNDKEKQNCISFYTITEFNNWAIKNDMTKWEHKYYKGLGTSDETEAQESFYNFEDNIVTFYWEKPNDDIGIDNDELKRIKNDMKKKSNNDNNNDNNDHNDHIDDTNNQSEYDFLKSKSHINISKAFDSKKTGERKLWLKNFDRNNIIEYKPKTKISYSEFIDRDMIFFSNLDNDRSIPSLIDGLKPSQRMILYTCIKRGRNSKEIRVAQLAGKVSETTAYHHGEVSIQSAIVGMAQNFPGSNNINLLFPSGCFGYRREGGDETASARYIHTYLDPIANLIFKDVDDDILEYNYDDNKQVEPKVFCPIIPMILVNGTDGIGTGFSTKILPHNPKDIVTNLKRLLNNQKPLEMLPWFRGFKGTIEKDPTKNNGYIIQGKYTVDGRSVHIEEIPIINGWIQKYEDDLARKISTKKDDDKKIESIPVDVRYNNKIDLVVIFKGQELQTIYKNGNIDKYLNMVQKISTNNLHLFNENGKLTKYANAEDILYNFYNYRLKIYEKRKEYILKKLLNDVDICKYKVLFIREYLKGIILIAKKKVADVIQQLEDRNYPRFSNDCMTSDEKKSYKYLTDMSIMSLTDDKIAELEDKIKECKMIYDDYFNTPIKKIWENDLDEFLLAYDIWFEQWNAKIFLNDNRKNAKNIKKNKNITVRKKNKIVKNTTIRKITKNA